MLEKKLSTGDFENLLREKGFKITPTRLLILDVFLKNDKPISADFISKKLKGKINEATIYRTLSSFEEVGILKRIDLRKDSIFYELSFDHHHHMVCIKCGKIEDFRENKDIEKLLDGIVKESKNFKKIKEHSLELFGYCKVCN